MERPDWDIRQAGNNPIGGLRLERFDGALGSLGESAGNQDVKKGNRGHPSECPLPIREATVLEMGCTGLND